MISAILTRVLFLLGRNERAARRLGVRIGTQGRILTRFFGSEPFLITIGDRVTLSRDVMFINHDGSSWLMRDDKGRRQVFREISIGNDVFVGARTTLLPGVAIGDHVVVGAGSVVTKSIPSNCVVGGNPAKFICFFDDLRTRYLAQYPAETDLPVDVDHQAFALAALQADRKPAIAVPR